MSEKLLLKVNFFWWIQCTLSDLAKHVKNTCNLEILYNVRDSLFLLAQWHNEVIDTRKDICVCLLLKSFDPEWVNSQFFQHSSRLFPAFLKIWNSSTVAGKGVCTFLGNFRGFSAYVWELRTWPITFVFHTGVTDGEAVHRKWIMSAEERGRWMNWRHRIRMLCINAEEQGVLSGSKRTRTSSKNGTVLFHFPWH